MVEAAENLEQRLVTRQGSLAKLVPQFDPDSIQTSAELTNERRLCNDPKLKKELRNTLFYTANVPLYAVEKGKFWQKKAVLYFGGREAFNIVYSSKNFENACEQLLGTGNYAVPTNDVEQAKSSMLRFEMSDLRLKNNGDNEWSYVEINTKNYKCLKGVRRQLAEAVYSFGEDFGKNMDMFAEERMEATRIYVLNPKYVMLHAKDKVIARACWLGNFSDCSSFNADDRSVGNLIDLRGVPLSSAEGGRAISSTGNKVPWEAKVVVPTMEEILAYAKPFVPEVGWVSFQTGLEAKYNRKA